MQVKHCFWTFAWLVQKISSYVGREYKINSNTVDNVTTIIQRLPCDIILEINYKLLLFCNLIVVIYDMSLMLKLSQFLSLLILSRLSSISST